MRTVALFLVVGVNLATSLACCGFNLGGNAWFTLAAGVPVTGPQLYDAEFISQFNWRF